MEWKATVTVSPDSEDTEVGLAAAANFEQIEHAENRAEA